MNSEQLSDGSWVPAKSLPFYKCVTPRWKRILLKIWFFNDEDAYEDALEWVPEKID